MNICLINIVQILFPRKENFFYFFFLNKGLIVKLNMTKTETHFSRFVESFSDCLAHVVWPIRSGILKVRCQGWRIRGNILKQLLVACAAFIWQSVLNNDSWLCKLNTFEKTPSTMVTVLVVAKVLTSHLNTSQDSLSSNKGTLMPLHNKGKINL